MSCGLTSDTNRQNGLDDPLRPCRNSTTLSPPTPGIWPGVALISPDTYRPSLFGLPPPAVLFPLKTPNGSSLRLLNGGARIRRVPAGPPPIRLHDLDVGRPPIFAAVAWRGVRGVAEVPLAFPDHVVTGMSLEEGGNGRLTILVNQSGP